jgi:probable F420-dependent oxidoreductase
MSRPFRFAVQSGPFDDPAALRVHARTVEDLGYGELYSFDHVGAVDPFLPLLVAAEATTMLRLGPLVVDNELHETVLLARTAATFDALSGGRLVLGMGTGYARDEHDAAGVPLRPPGPRVRRFEESLIVLRRLLDEGSATMDGDHLRIAVDDLGVRPVQPGVPLLVGGNGRRVVGVAARRADVFQFTGLTHDPVTGVPSGGGFPLAEVRRRLAWLREAAGERFDAIELSVLVQQTHVGAGADAAIEAAATRLGSDRELVSETPFLLMGSLAQVVEKVHRIRDELGVNHLVVRHAAGFAPVVEALAGT